MLLAANIYGIFQPLTDVFQTVLKFFHSAGIGWGLAIVLLTVAVRAVMVPLTLRQIKSMVRMQALGPQMKEIQQKYKEDKPRQQEEMMKFYRENNVNPLGSCLPLLLQLPVFFALYAMLRQSLRGDICPQVQRTFQAHYAAVHQISLAAAHGHTASCGKAPGAGFLFIHDLTAQATGLTLVALIVLYVGSQLASSVLMSGASMDPNQRRIMMFMPLIFVVFIYRFPAGFLVYWITTNLWTIGQQYVVKRRIGPAQAAVAAAGAGGGALAGGGSGGPAGGGSGGSGGGGLGGRLFDRLRAAQENAAASRSGNGGAPDGAGDTAAAGKASGRGSSTASRSAPASGSGSGARRSGGGRSGGGRSGNGGQAGRGGNGSGGGSGGSGGGSRAGSRSRSRSGSGAGSGSGSGAGSGAASGSGSGAASGSGSGSASGGSGTGSGGNGNGASARSGAPPPRPPRKKKKRSGRRR